jgi:hypothetical protein
MAQTLLKTFNGYAVYYLGSLLCRVSLFEIRVCVSGVPVELSLGQI